MHSSSSTSTPSSTGTSNIEQYHYPPISTLRRASRPVNINLPLFNHNHTEQANDPGIYSAPICYIKPSNDHPHHMQQSPQSYTASFHYQHRPEQHVRLPAQNLNIQLRQLPPPPPPQQQQQQQQQPLLDPYSQHQHTPHTFPLQGSPNHYQQCFYFPPSRLQAGATTNGHQTASPHNNHLRAVHIQEQQTWSNPALSSLMLERMNKNTASMTMDDDDEEDPSASIDALVADVDSDLLDDQQDKSLDPSKTTSTTPHLYLRSTSNILTTPPNPLAADDHPDNQITVGQNFQKDFTPIPSAGFELTTNNNNNNNNNNVKISSSSNTTAGTTFFTFDINHSESNDFKNQHHDSDQDEEKIPKPLLINSDIRQQTATNFIQDDNSNQSSTSSSTTHQTSSGIFNQMLRSSEQQGLSSSSPLSHDIKLSPLDLANHPTNIHSMQSRHFCAHPDCNKMFANKSALAKHKLTHSQDRKHKCSRCNKGFKRLDHLNGHMLTHEEEKPHKCRIPSCNRTYCDGRSLKRHIENVHQDILAAIGEGKHPEYLIYLPETAVVKIKDLSINSEFSIDSVDSNSPHSLNDNEQSFHIRTSTGTKLLTTYTYDEEKCVECQICKKPFKNGAALNGHMRLHGGFNEKQPSPSSTENTPKKKPPQKTKRKRVESVTIKREAQDVSMISSMNGFYPAPPPPSSSSSFTTLPPCSDVLPQRYQEQPLSTRVRSTSSFAPNPPPAYSQFTINNPSGGQTPKQTRISPYNPHAEHFGDKFRKSSSSPDNAVHHRSTNGVPHQYPYIPQSLHQHPPHPLPAQYPIPSNSLPANLLHHLLRQRDEQLKRDPYHSHRPPSSFDEMRRYTPSPNSTSSPMNNTPVASPHSNQNLNHSSPMSTVHISNHNPLNSNGMPSLSATHSISSSSPPSSSHTALKKRILDYIKQGTHEEKPVPIVENLPPPSPAVLEIVADADTPVKENMSGFLIGTPSSTGASSSSSSASSQKHFNYDEVPAPPKRESTPSSFQWPSQFRRQLSLTIPHATLNPVPSTPYTPPPMLSPFRKGPGLYYRVFSHPAPSTETSSIPTTPINDESTNPKINIGRDYQAMIPKLRNDIDKYNDNPGDELLFSPLEFPSLDEKSLDKFEQLNRMNPFLFSPRHSPASYPLELVYMLLYEYNGDFQRTLAALLEGTAKDIKQCRPLHHHRFPECEQWTKQEMDAFTKATQSSEKNFELVSRAVRTKTVKQCIEFHYMPKVNLTSRKISPKATSSVVTRRKRFQMIRAKQQLEDETSSSSFNESRFDEDGSTIHSDSSPAAQFSCDIDECSQTFPTDRACRAHRKQHRRNADNMTSAKRSRPIDMNK